MSFKTAIPRAMLFVTAIALSSVIAAGCGGPKFACENPGNHCMNYSKTDCRSGTFTEGKTCEDLGYRCDPNGGGCKK